MNTLQKSAIYLKMSIKAMMHNPSFHTINGSIKYFPGWLKHLTDRKNSVSDNMPWLAFGAIDFIKSIVRTNMSVFEYGSGGSTLFWSLHVKSVVSVEHEPSWYVKMASEFSKKQIGNVEYILAEAEDDKMFETKSFLNPGDYISADNHFKGKSFEGYVKQIDRFPDQSFDLIIIDGRARPSCIAHSLTKLKQGGYLVVDNSEREYYLSPFTINRQDWNVWKFYGPVPYNYNFSETSIFQKLVN